MAGLWHQLDFWLGLLTSVLVLLAWGISMVSQPMATAFGGSVALAGMAVAYGNSLRGRVPVVTLYLDNLPDALLAVLTAGDPRNDGVIKAALNEAHSNRTAVVFLYLAEPTARRVPRLFEVMDPYLDDQSAKDTLKQAALLARKARVTSRFVYQPQAPGVTGTIWQTVRPHDVVLPAERLEQVEEINPDRIRYELTPPGPIAHLLKHW